MLYELWKGGYALVILLTVLNLASSSKLEYVNPEPGAGDGNLEPGAGEENLEPGAGDGYRGGIGEENLGIASDSLRDTAAFEVIWGSGDRDIVFSNKWRVCDQTERMCWTILASLVSNEWKELYFGVVKQ